MATKEVAGLGLYGVRIMMNRLETVREKAHELALISSWASQNKLDRVRDLCNSAMFELGKEEARIIMMGDHSQKPQGIIDATRVRWDG